MRRLLSIAAMVIALFLAAREAAAHATLERASPSAGSTVAPAPREIRLWFSEALEPRFSRATVTNAAGATLGRGSVAGARNQIVIHVGALAPGVYTVSWRVVSVDSHKTEGDFTFTVRP